MVFDFIVLIREEDIKKIKVSEDLVEWGGENYSQDPPQYKYTNSSLFFHKFLSIDSYKRYFKEVIGNDLKIDEFIPFILLGNQMLEIEKLINTNDTNMLNHDIFKFLDNLCELDEFAIFVERDEEYVDKRYHIKTKEELINIFCNCLSWNCPEGALITKLNK